MNKTQRKTLIGSMLIIVLAILFTTVALVGCRSETDTAKRQIEFLLGDIEWPDEMTILHNRMPTGFTQGSRNPQNTLFQLKNFPDEMLAKHDFEKAYNPDQIPAMGFGLGIVYTHALEGFSPPWDEGFFWFGEHPAFLIFFPSELWLFAIIIPR